MLSKGVINEAHGDRPGGGVSLSSFARLMAAMSLLIIPLGLTAAFTSHKAYGWITEQDAEGFDLCSSNFFDNNQNLVNFWNNTPWTTIGVYLGGSGAASVGCQATPPRRICGTHLVWATPWKLCGMATRCRMEAARPSSIILTKLP